MLMTTPTRTLTVGLFAFLLGACSTEDDSGSNEEPTGTCDAQVVIGFYTDPECTQEVAASSPTRTYDTTRSCFDWVGNSAAGENSATNFQCYRDRLCYTQHPATLTCDGNRFTDKEARTDVCLLDTANPNGGEIYAKIVSGTEGCPAAPAGFECPASASGEGTPGIAACSSEQ